MRIVVVSPFPAERTALYQLLTDDGHLVSAVETRREGIELAAAVHHDVFLADAQVAGADGHAIVRALAERGLRMRVILLCPRAREPFEDGDVICLTKPIDLDQLRRHLHAGLPTGRQVA